jgi:hypothetical protein
MPTYYVPEVLMSIILSFCGGVDALKVAAVSREWYGCAWKRLSVQSALPQAHGNINIRYHIARSWFSVSTEGRRVATYAPGMGGGIVTVLDTGMARWPSCYGTVFSSIRTDHRMLPCAKITKVCLVEGFLLACCSDGVLLTWPVRAAMSGMVRVPTGTTTVDVNFVALCADDEVVDNAFALTDTGALWVICADPRSPRFGAMRVYATSSVIARQVECMRGRILLHDDDGGVWVYSGGPSPLLVPVRPTATAGTIPFVACLVAHGGNGLVLVAVACAGYPVTSLYMCGPTSVSTVQFSPCMPRRLVLQMSSCRRTGCLLVAHDAKMLLVVRVSHSANVVSSAVEFALPGAAVLCLIAEMLIDTNGGLWCLDMEYTACISMAKLRYVGQFAHGVLSTSAAAAVVLTPLHLYV